MHQSTAGPGFDPVDWRGHWIAPELLVDPEALPVGFQPPMPVRGFSRALFRRKFQVDNAAASAPIRLTADSRYVLWVNGVEIGRGPVRSHPRRWHYDEYDIADRLVPGANVVAVLVTYYGRANSIWQPAAASGGVGADAILALEGRIGEQGLVSDASWRVHRSTAWSELASSDGVPIELDGVPVELLDARRLAPGWQRVGFDDSAWARAAVVAAVHVGSLARTRPPTNPYGRLHPRPIGPLSGETVDATAVSVAVTSNAAIAAWTSDHPAERVMQVQAATGDARAADLPVTAVVDDDVTVLVTVDFGRIVAGFVELKLTAAPGTVVELQYREDTWRAGPGGPRTGARYVTRGGGETFSSVEVNGLRFLHAAIHSSDVSHVRIDRVSVREHLYPLVGGASFTSSDPEINALYRAGRRTVALNSLDAFIDCPTREQRSWVGDGVIHQMVHLTCSEDWRLARRYIELADAPRYDGMLPMSVVGDFEMAESYAIPDWALHWIHGLHNLYRYTGDRVFVADHLTSAQRILAWYADYVDAHGTISNVAEWNLIDWSGVFTSGRSSAVTALWARGLTEFADMSEWIGNGANARWAQQLHRAAKVGFEDFWDPGRGVYVDHFVDREKLPAASQAANAAAIVSGLVPEARWAGIASTVTDPTRTVVSDWVGSYEVDGVSGDRLQDQLRGIQRITWEAEHQFVRAEPFFSYIVHDALALSGLHDRLLASMRDWTRFLGAGYDTFGECWEWGTHVHGWSSTPTRDLVQHILGVTPIEPGFTRVRIAPRLAGLHEISGTVPTPYGLITLRVTEHAIRLSTPVPALVSLGDAEEIEIPAGEFELIR